MFMPLQMPMATTARKFLPEVGKHWHESTKLFSGVSYQFDLHPDDSQPFAGSTGAVRNFTWLLSGQKPDGSRFYGSDLAVYNEPGSSLMMDEVEITLTPEGLLIDGNKGQAIVKSLTDIGGGEDGIRDIPIGKYTIGARNRKTGKPLQVRLRNKGSYGNQLNAIFTSGFTGITNYKIAIQVAEKNL